MPQDFAKMREPKMADVEKRLGQRYTRPSRTDLDAISLPGWSATELLPHLTRFETYHKFVEPSAFPASAGPIHGVEGPVAVSSGGFRAERVEQALLSAAAAAGYPEVHDLQNLDGKTANGFERYVRYVSPEGTRQDAATAFVHPVLDAEADEEADKQGRRDVVGSCGGALHVLVEHKVVRILFDAHAAGNGSLPRAVGVEIVRNPRFLSTSELSSPSRLHEKCASVRARRLVVVACGAYGSPGVLERSGLGRVDVLARAGIARVPGAVDLPGVGERYQDHQGVMSVFEVDVAAWETLDDIWTQGRAVNVAGVEVDRRRGWNGIDVIGKVRPTEARLKELGVEFERGWTRDYSLVPDRPLVLIGFLNG